MNNRARSPKFPYIDLKKCVHYTVELYKEAKTTLISEKQASKILKLSATSSTTSRSFSAMTYFGLLKRPRSKDVVQVTDLGKEIAIAYLTKSLDLELLRKAARRPEIIDRILTEQNWWDGLPSDEVLESTIKYRYSFQDRAVSRFVSVLRDTYEYANLDESFDDYSELPLDNITTSNDVIDQSSLAPNLLDNTSLGLDINMENIKNAFTIPSGEVVLSMSYPKNATDSERKYIIETVKRHLELHLAVNKQEPIQPPQSNPVTRRFSKNDDDIPF